MLASLESSRESKAALIVAYSPDVEVPDRTTMAPEGGDVLDAANARVTVARKHCNLRSAFEISMMVTIPL